MPKNRNFLLSIMTLCLHPGLRSGSFPGLSLSRHGHCTSQGLLSWRGLGRRMGEGVSGRRRGDRERGWGQYGGGVPAQLWDGFWPSEPKVWAQGRPQAVSFAPWTLGPSLETRSSQVQRGPLCSCHRDRGGCTFIHSFRRYLLNLHRAPALLGAGTRHPASRGLGLSSVNWVVTMPALGEGV